MKIIEYPVMAIGICLIIIPQVIRKYVLEAWDWIVESINTI